MSFQILVEAANNMFVGIGPFSPEDEAAVAPDYFVTVINDDGLVEWIDQNVFWPPFAHLEADHQSFTLVDEWP